MTFGTLYKQIREEKRLSLQDCAKNSSTHPSMVWMAENGTRRPGGKVMARICLKGLKLKEDSDEWIRLCAAWLTECTGVKVAPGFLAGRMAVTYLKNNKEAERFFANVSKLPDEQFAELAKAAARPEIMAALSALNSIYEAKG